MKKLTITLLFSIYLFTLNAQQNLSEGYFITNDGKRVTCFINNDIKRNDNSFLYKESPEDSQYKIIETKSIQEFGINNKNRFIKANVAIDQSNNKNGNFDFNKNPVWKQQEVFLEVIVDGEADLFYYTNDTFKRLFYRLGDSEIKQLVYVKYLVTDTKSRENNQYKQTLKTKLTCNSFDNNTFNNLRYTTSSLKKLFIKYNDCIGAEQVVYENFKKRQAAKFKIKAGLNFGKMTLSKLFDDNIDVDLGLKGPKPNLGFEYEYALPIKSTRNWTLALELLLGNGYISRKELSPDQSTTSDSPYVKGTHGTFEIPLRIRKYFHVAKDTRVFGDVAYGLSLGGGTIKYETNRRTPNDGDTSYLRLGAGINYKKWDLELQYRTPRTTTFRFINTEARYSSLTMYLSYQLF